MCYSKVVLTLALSIMSGSLLAQSTGTGGTGTGGTGTGGTGTGGTGTGTGGTGTGTGGTGTGGTGSTSTGAAYAASCLSDPLPTTPTGPTWTQTLDVPTMTSAGTSSTTEPVTITFWRVPCSGGGSATVGLLQRSQDNASSAGTFAEFPGLTIQQGSQSVPVRVSGVPNTQSSSIVAGTPVANQQSFVLENATAGDTSSFTGTSDFNFSSGMTLGFTAGGSSSGSPLDIPTYDLNAYPTAILSMPITGYNTGNYFDPQHAGEGIQIEVGSLSSNLAGTGSGGSGGTGTSCNSSSGSGNGNGNGTGSGGSGGTGTGTGGTGTGSGGTGTGSGGTGTGTGTGTGGTGTGGTGTGGTGTGSGGTGTGTGGTGTGTGGTGTGNGGTGSGGTGSGSDGTGSSNCTTSYITVAWYTFDSNGLPYWLFGMATFNPGDRSAAVPMMNTSDGGFAGNFNQATTTEWGTMNVDFPDCSTMHFTFAANDGLADGVPTGSGDLDWQRLTQISGLTCQ